MVGEIGAKSSHRVFVVFVGLQSQRHWLGAAAVAATAAELIQSVFTQNKPTNQSSAGLLKSNPLIMALGNSR